MARATEISPDCTDVPSGWPRPFYRDPTTGARSYVQWITRTASGQIFECENDRTWTAASHFLCTSCGSVMERGLILDRKALQDMAFTYSVGHKSARKNSAHMDWVDGHIGGAMCYRCAIFAAKFCPWFSGLHRATGDAFPWLIVTDAHDYHEIDASGAIDVVDRGRLETTTTGEVRAEVQAGRLWLADDDAEPVIQKRPTETVRENGVDYEDETWWNEPVQS